MMTRMLRHVIWLVVLLAPCWSVLAWFECEPGSAGISGLLVALIVMASTLVILGIIYHLRYRLAVRDSEIEATSKELNDMSSRRQEAEQNYQWLFNTISDGVIVCDLKPDGSPGAIGHANNQACAMLGRTHEEMKSLAMSDLFVAADRQMIPDLLDNLRSQGAILFQIRMEKGDGSARNVEIHANLTEAGGEWKVLSVIRDNEERVIQERNYRDKMEELERRFNERTRDIEDMSREVKLLAGTVSHDLQAPLTSVQDSLERVKRNCVINDTEVEEEFIRTIQQIQKMNSLIKGILEYSRLGRNELTSTTLGLSQVCSEVLLQLDGVIRARKADVLIERPMPLVLAHATTLFRIIQNLVSNAIKFVDHGTGPKVILRAESRGKMVRLWVIDNGIGIAPEDHERIFNVFQRLHGMEEYPGDGLGLAIVRRGVNRLKGSMGVLSEPGKGSRFWIELPAGLKDESNSGH